MRQWIRGKIKTKIKNTFTYLMKQVRRVEKPEEPIQVEQPVQETG